MQGPLNGWHTVFDATTGLWRLANLKDGVVTQWGSQPAPPKAAPPKPEPKPTVQNYGVSLDELRKEAPVGWTTSKGAQFKPPLPPGGADKALGQQVAWPSIEQARGFDVSGYVAPGIVILSALWLILHPHKGKR